jgi:hypothetical protein
MNAALQTDQDFQSMVDEDHYRGPTPLSCLPVGLVTCFVLDVLDYMHLVCLGVMRRMVHYWLKGPIAADIRLRGLDVEQLSERLVTLANFISSDFGRRPRSLSEVDRWKATDFRQLLS